MAIVSASYKLVFIMNPRTGSTALGKIIVNHMEGRCVPPEDILDSSGKIYVPAKHTTISQIRRHSLLSETLLDEYTKFTAIRNPFDSLVSLWAKKKFKYSDHQKADSSSFVNKLPGYTDDIEFIANHSFSDWILKKFKGKEGRSVNLKYTQGVDEVVRFESLQSDFRDLMKRMRAKVDLAIPRENITNSRDRDYRQYYTQEAREVVEDSFYDELQRYGYEF